MAVRALVLVLAFVGLAAALPAGFTTWFDSEDCPTGWYPLSTTQGRLILSVQNSNDAGITVGSPLGDAEDRVHSHGYTSRVTFESKQIAAIGCCNDQGAASGTYTVTDSLHNSTSGLPFVQLVLCTVSKASILPEPVPFGTVAFFEPSVTSCPQDWAPLQLASGRFMLPGYTSKGLVPSDTKPMTSGKDIVHAHTYATQLKPIEVSYEGIASCCDSGPSHASPYNVSGNSTVDSTGLPYIALLTCVSQAPTFDAKLPPEALLFNEVGCPPGWNVSLAHSGRLLVSLPRGGTPGATFGGASLRPGTTADVSHSHTFASSIRTQSVGVGLASGCCAGGYAGNNDYPFSGVSDTASVQLPYLSAPICMKTS